MLTEVHFNFCTLSENPQEARFLHDVYDAIKHFFVHVSHCIQSKFKFGRPMKALSHNALYSFSEKWRLHADVFMKFLNIFLAINVKDYFFRKWCCNYIGLSNTCAHYHLIWFICKYLRMTTQHGNTQDLYYRLYFTCFYNPMK